MKIYRGTIVGKNGDRYVTVEQMGTQQPLHHLVYHSPTGFAWGYMGSGPADLAASLLADHLGLSERPPPGFYQRFKQDVIAVLPIDEDWELTSAEIGKWIRGMERIGIHHA